MKIRLENYFGFLSHSQEIKILIDDMIKRNSAIIKMYHKTWVK